MTANLRQPNSPGKSGVPDSCIRQLPEALAELEQQFLPGGVLQSEVTRSQGLKVFQDRLPDAEPDEFGLHGRKHRVPAAGSGPFPQDGKLLGFVLQVLENSREENVDQVFKGDVFPEVGGICRFTQSTVTGGVTNGLVKNPASLVPPEIIGDAPDYLLKVSQEVPVVLQVLAVDGATCSRRSSATLDCGNGGIDEFLTARTGQITRKSRVGSQVSQKTFSQPGELPPLLVSYSRQRIVHIGIGPISLLLPWLRLFRFHSKTRVWRVSRSGEQAANWRIDQRKG